MVIKKYVVYQGRKLNGIVFSNEVTGGGGILDGQIQLLKKEFCQEKQINIPILTEIRSQEPRTIFVHNLEALVVPF